MLRRRKGEGEGLAGGAGGRRRCWCASARRADKGAGGGAAGGAESRVVGGREGGAGSVSLEQGFGLAVQSRARGPPPPRHVGGGVEKGLAARGRSVFCRRRHGVASARRGWSQRRCRWWRRWRHVFSSLREAVSSPPRGGRRRVVVWVGWCRWRHRSIDVEGLATRGRAVGRRRRHGGERRDGGGAVGGAAVGALSWVSPREAA